MNPSFFGFFPKSKKVFYFILILNYFLPAGCRSLRWKISFSFSVLKTLLPFLFLLALSLKSNLLIFIFVSQYIMCLLTYVKILFLSVVLKNLTIFPLVLFSSSFSLPLLPPSPPASCTQESFYCLAQRVYNFHSNEGNFQLLFLQLVFSPFSWVCQVFFITLNEVFPYSLTLTFYFSLCLVIWVPDVTSSLSSAMLHLPLILSSLFFIPNTEILISRSLIQVYL